MIEYFPNGVWQYILGGCLLGLAVVLLFLFRGQPVGASTAFAAALSPFSKLPFLSDKRLINMRSSRLMWSAGFILGGLVFALSFNDWFVTDVSIWRLLVGGLFVGFGVRMGRGCTAGHGVCGVASRSAPSLLAVVIFTVIAIITANILAVIL